MCHSQDDILLPKFLNSALSWYIYDPAYSPNHIARIIFSLKTYCKERELAFVKYRELAITKTLPDKLLTRLITRPQCATICLYNTLFEKIDVT